MLTHPTKIAHIECNSIQKKTKAVAKFIHETLKSGAWIIENIHGNSISVDVGFLAWILIGWWLCCQPVRNQVWKSLLTYMDFNMDFSVTLAPGDTQFT